MGRLLQGSLRLAPLLWLFLLLLLLPHRGVTAITPVFNCWFTEFDQTTGSRHYTLLWDYRVEETGGGGDGDGASVIIPHGEQNRFWPPALDDKTQPIEFLVPGRQYAHTVRIPYTGHDDLVVTWTLDDSHAAIAVRDLVESNECRVRHGAACPIYIPGFCQDATWCNGLEQCFVATATGLEGSCIPAVRNDDDAHCTTTCDEETLACEPACTKNEHCDNGRWCDGQEVCDTLTSRCLPGTPPCKEEGEEGEVCIEFERQCVARECRLDTDCDDGNLCSGTEYCDRYRCVTDASSAPCEKGQAYCNAQQQYCMECLTTDECNTGRGWCDHPQLCVQGLCMDDPSQEPPCKDALHCDAKNQKCIVCRTDDECVRAIGKDPAQDWCIAAVECVTSSSTSSTDGGGTTATCQVVERCVDEGLFCDASNERCSICVTDQDCDDGVWCNGHEVCSDGGVTCTAGQSPCLQQELLAADDAHTSITCVEQYHQCVVTWFCEVDADCDDGVWCNGQEMCNTTTNECESDPAGPPCQSATEICVETANRCVDTGAPRTIAIIVAAVIGALFCIAICVFSGIFQRLRAALSPTNGGGGGGGGEGGGEGDTSGNVLLEGGGGSGRLRHARRYKKRRMKSQ